MLASRGHRRTPARSPLAGIAAPRGAARRSPRLGREPAATCAGDRTARAGALGERGQASLLLVAGLAAVLVGVLVLGAVARGVAREATRSGGGPRRARRRAGDARRVPAAVRAGGARRPRRTRAISSAPRTSRAAARPRSRRRGATARTTSQVASPTPDTFAPVRIRVDVRERVEVAGADERVARRRARPRPSSRRRGATACR